MDWLENLCKLYKTLIVLQKQILVIMIYRPKLLLHMYSIITSKLLITFFHVYYTNYLCIYKSESLIGYEFSCNFNFFDCTTFSDVILLYIIHTDVTFFRKYWINCAYIYMNKLSLCFLHFLHWLFDIDI